MRKVIVMIIAMAVAMVVVPTLKAANKAEEGAISTGNVKIAVVDLSRALNEVGEGKKAKANLESEFKSKKSELDGIKNEIETMRQSLEKKSPVMSQEALKDDRDNYQRKFIEYQQKAKDYTEDLARKEGETTSKIIGKLRTVVEQIAQRDGYTFVLEKSQGGVLYGPQSADITDELIKQYK